VVFDLENEALRIGVVGLGKMGWLHASLLSVLPNARLVALCEKSGVTRKIAKKVFRLTPVVKEIDDFSDFDLDVVYVTTSTGSHFDVAKKVYEQNLARHVFVEKPLTSAFSKSRELCELAELRKGVNMVGYLRRFMVTFIKAKELLMQGVIGEPLSFSLGAYSSDFHGFNGDSKFSAARGGVLTDLGCYAVDIAMWFFGLIQLDSAKIDSVNGFGSEDVACFSVYDKSESLRGEVVASWCNESYRMPEVILSIVGSKGAIEVNDYKASLSLKDGVKSVWYRHDLDDHVKFWLGAPEYYTEDAYFINCAVNSSLAEPSFKTASNVDAFVETIRQKASKHE
jgi:predicted dehydrogenase